MVKIIKNNVWLILILLLASMFRVYRLDYLELFGDELDAGYQSYSLLQTGRDYRGNFMPFYMHSFSEWRAPGMMYAMVPFIKVFGLNEWGVRLPEAFFGVLSIFVFYWLLIELKIKKEVALGSALFLAISPWHIQYSRSGFELALLSFSLISGIWCLLRGIKTGRALLIVLASVLFGVSIYTYNTANIYVPLLSVLTLVFAKARLRHWIILATTGILVCLPLIYQVVFGYAAERFSKVSIIANKEIVATVNDYRNADNSSLMSKIFFNKYSVSIRRVLYNYTNAFSSDFLFRTGDVTFRHSFHMVGYFYWVSLPLILIGLFVSKNWFMVWWLLIAPIPSSLTFDGYNHGSRLFLLLFPLCFFAGVGFDWLSKQWKVVVGTVALVEILFFQYYYWNFYRQESWRWWHTGYKEAMTYVTNNKDSYQKVLIDNTYEPALIRYLFWSKTSPVTVFNLVDTDNYCVSQVCFVNFGDKFEIEKLDKNTLYLLSHERNVGGTRDIEKEPVVNIEVLKTVRNYDSKPIFYLVRGR